MPNKIKENNEQTPVLIIGGGLTGLSAALFLLQQGIRPLLVERHASTSIHPRSRGFDVRTMELFRGLQVDDEIREAGKALAVAWGMYAGADLKAITDQVSPDRERVKHPVEFRELEKLAALSPVSGARCPQDLCEPILLKTAIARGADVRFHTELLSFTQTTDQVTAYIRNRDNGETSTVTCQYMIAADGSSSPVRRELNAATTGPGPLGTLLNVYFESPLTEQVRDREFSLGVIERPGISGMLAAINNSDKWVLHLHYDANHETPGDYTNTRLLQIIREIIGIPDFPVRIISVLPWQPTVNAVTNMQYGRIFIAGDAAHQMTPYGGKGAATGVQDVHNLAWKLALVLQQKASPALLNTYSPERQPIGLENALLSGSMANDKGLVNINIIKQARENATREGDFAWMKRLLGLPDYTYTSAAIAGKPAAPASDIIKADGQPGTRVPHLWLHENGVRQSTIDLAVTHFLLITTDNGEAWQETAANVAQRFNIPLPVKSITTEEWKTAAKLQPGMALLVRPDGFIAWRSDDPEYTLTTAMQRILSCPGLSCPGLN
ncbi:FAD-dependent oxidoreductase [Chitinophaga hostae]|uniref:FAD-dependent oxidoreductase n=1 Tax=Chitinophaga hostae TaxID=2831022 RepID=UPI003F6A3C68